jgi:trehalose-6-phosphate synthase
LLLSRFAGAAGLLKGALTLNPYDVESVAHLIRRALVMAPTEVATRMETMRSLVREHNVFRWMLDILAAASQAELAGADSGGREDALLAVS